MMKRKKSQRQGNHETPTDVNVDRDMVPPNLQQEEQKRNTVNPILKYLREDWNVKSDKNISRLNEVQKNYQADLDND